MARHPGAGDEEKKNKKINRLSSNFAAPISNGQDSFYGGSNEDVNLSPVKSLPSLSSSTKLAVQITPAPQQQLRRQAVVVSTDVDLIVENGAGSTIAEATLQGLPTAPIDVPLPIGTLSLPALASAPGVISLPADDLNTNPASSLVPTPTTPLSIQVPDSSSQIVISSPPTPAPSDSSTFPLSSPSPSPFPSIATFNSTATSSLIPTSNHASFTTNSTITPSSTVPSTFITSTTSLTSTSSNTSSSITSNPSTSSSILATNTGGIGGGGASGGSATSSAPAATSTTAAPPAVGSSVNAPVIGGVIGGLAGLALLLLAALFFLRRYKRQRRRAAEALPPGDNESAPPGTSHSGAPMAQHSAAPWGAGALGPLMRRIRPNSTFTAATSDTGNSERGFQKISGRKIESVLVSGGDGFGGRGPGAGNLSGQSFYRDSSGTYGGGQSQNSSMVVGPASPRKSAATSDFTDMSGIAGPSTAGRSSDKEVVTMRPGPARQAVASPAYTFAPQFPGDDPVPPSSERGFSPGPSQGLRAPDPIGRSRPSFDGSRGSKFAEDLG